jgi:hypothetical protein
MDDLYFDHTLQKEKSKENNENSKKLYLTKQCKEYLQKKNSPEPIGPASQEHHNSTENARLDKICTKIFTNPDNSIDYLYEDSATEIPISQPNIAIKNYVSSQENYKLINPAATRIFPNYRPNIGTPAPTVVSNGPLSNHFG